MARLAPAGQSVIRTGQLSLCPDSHVLSAGHRSVRLTPMEFRLVAYLMRQRGEPVPIPELLERVWGYPKDTAGAEVVRAHIRNLRAKLQAHGFSRNLIQTHPRVGYALEAVVADRHRPSKRR